MKNLLFVSAATFFIFFITVAAHAQYTDPVPQSAQSDELRLLRKILEGKTFEEERFDKGVSFTFKKPGDLKMQRGTGYFIGVESVRYEEEKTEYDGTQKKYFFKLVNGKVHTISLKPVNNYREVLLFLTTSGCSEKITGYVPPEIAEFRKIEISY